MMTQTQPRPKSELEQAVETSLPTTSENSQPAWLQSLQQNARQQFNTLGLPTRRQESWRFVDLNLLTSQGFEPFTTTDIPHLLESTVSTNYIPEANATRLVFINGQFVSHLSAVENLPQGVIISELSQARQAHDSLIQKTLGKTTSAEPNVFAELNTAVFNQGAFIYIPANTCLEQPVQLLFITENQTGEVKMASPRVLIVAENFTKATVLSNFIGNATNATYLNNVVTEIVAGEGAEIEYNHIQDEALNAHQLAATQVNLEKHSRVQLASFSFGSKLSRHEISVTSQGEQTHAGVYGLSVLNGETQVHDRTILTFTKPHCTSDQLYKSILDGRSKSEFDGIIVINRNCPQIDAAQLNKNLLLSDDARVYTRPQLKIDTDDVKCAHGATVGQLNDEELFYLASRGLSPQMARSVLTVGFAEEVSEKVSVASVRKYLDERIHRSLTDLTNT